MSHRTGDNLCAAYTIRNPSNAIQDDPDVEEDIKYLITSESQISEQQWHVCAETFSEHYGVWSHIAASALGPWATEGRRIMMSPRKLRALCVPEGANNILITAVTGAGDQIGHCLVSEWEQDGCRVWWITQLVVRTEYRGRKKATRMLQALVKHYDIGKNAQLRDRVGVLSSHPYTICTVLRVFGRGVESLPSIGDLEPSPLDVAYMPLRGQRCIDILGSSPVEYVRTARVQPDSLSAFTNFFVDHDEPDQALNAISYGMNRQTTEPWHWYFGELAEGCEYLCILEYRFDPEYSMQTRRMD